MRKALISLSKNILIKALILVIIAVFALWGIGDMFSGGKNNVIAEISGKNIYTQEYADELRQEMQIQNISNGKDILKNNLHTKVLNNIISDKIIELYASEEGIIINDIALANFLKQIPEFQENNQFSRTKYEKYLLQNNITSADFEKNYKKNLLKQLVIDSQIQGVSATKYHTKLVKDYYSKQASISYIDLKNIYEKYTPQVGEIKNYYDKKPFYTDEFRSVKYSIINLKNNENEDTFFKKISSIENLVLSNKTFKEITEQFSLNIEISPHFNVNGIDINGKNVAIDKNIITKTFSLNDQVHTDFVEITGKFYLLSINKIIPKKIKPLDETTKKQISEIISEERLQEKINKLKSNKNNKKIFEEIFEKNNKFKKSLFINSRFDKNLFFSFNQVQEILELNNDDFLIVQNNDSYLVKIEKISFNDKVTSNEMNNLFQKQVLKNFQDQILITFDKFLNQRYQIKINQKVLDRIINSF